MNNIVVMILRVWALYNRARHILGALFMLYAVEVITSAVACVKFSTQNMPMGM